MILNKRLWIGLGWAALICVSNLGQADELKFDRAENGTVYFTGSVEGKTPNPLKTGLFNLGYVGTLNPKKTAVPYYIFTGKSCENCNDEEQIYILRPSPGEKAVSFVYPGKIIDSKHQSMVVESKAFFGKCLSKKDDVFVVFQKERVDRHGFQSSVFIAEASPQHLSEKLIERHLPRIRTTEQLVKKKVCFEIAGRKRQMTRKTIAFRPNSDDDDDDDDDSDKNDRDDLHLVEADQEPKMRMPANSPAAYEVNTRHNQQKP